MMADNDAAHGRAIPRNPRWRMGARTLEMPGPLGNRPTAQAPGDASAGNGRPSRS